MTNNEQGQVILEIEQHIDTLLSLHSADSLSQLVAIELQGIHIILFRNSCQLVSVNSISSDPLGPFYQWERDLCSRLVLRAKAIPHGDCFGSL